MQNSVCSCTDCIVNHVDSVITVFGAPTFFDKKKSMVEYYLFGRWVSCNNGLD